MPCRMSLADGAAGPFSSAGLPLANPSPAPNAPSALRPRRGHSLQALTPGLDVLTEGAACGLEPFHWRITCQDRNVNGDDFNNQYLQVMY
jgi:hypothetical protein